MYELRRHGCGQNLDNNTTCSLLISYQYTRVYTPPRHYYSFDCPFRLPRVVHIERIAWSNRRGNLRAREMAASHRPRWAGDALFALPAGRLFAWGQPSGRREGKSSSAPRDEPQARGQLLRCIPVIKWGEFRRSFRRDAFPRGRSR